MSAKLREIAAEIDAFLHQFEADPVINKPSPGGNLRPYYHAQAYAAGARIFIIYVTYQGRCAGLTRERAVSFLEGLRGGFIGRHYEWERAMEKKGSARV